MIKCSSCDKDEATAFYTYELWARAWRNNPRDYVAHLCDRCLPLTTGTQKKVLSERLYITKEDYLAALAMAEL